MDFDDYAAVSVGFRWPENKKGDLFTVETLDYGVLGGDQAFRGHLTWNGCKGSRLARVPFVDPDALRGPGRDNVKKRRCPSSERTGPGME